MLAYSRGWRMQKTFRLPETYVPPIFISVIIAARNEADNIGACIGSLLKQDYPPALFEVIVVDDHSEDDTAKIVGTYTNNNVRCIALSDHIDREKIIAYKKAAIAAGIAQSRGELIVTTDADCITLPGWLKNIAAIYEAEQAIMIVAPVIYSSDKSIVQVFQLIDFMSMQGITAATHTLGLGNMSNGANLAFTKQAYQQVGGYDSIDHLASGDDMLLMMKMNRFLPGRISYLKSEEAIITTAPQPDWTSFLQQRIRWASKSGKYNDVKLTLVLVLVYLFNLSFLVLVISGFFHPVLFCAAGGMLLIKVISEYIFLVPVAKFFKKEWALTHFFFLQPLHIAYIILAGFLGFVGVYKWKGRKVK
jgi:cellulose synthase/poly-beta-1,6-N-acetylglucosamine synthase-like glycosyltransferase